MRPSSSGCGGADESCGVDDFASHMSFLTTGSFEADVCIDLSSVFFVLILERDPHGVYRISAMAVSTSLSSDDYCASICEGPADLCLRINYLL